LDVARLLDAEDIVNMPRPDERSIMTYVAQLYQVFSSLDKVEVAGRRIGKLCDFAKSIFDLQHDYERRATALKSSVNTKIQELNNAPLGNDYQTSRQLITEFRNYRKTEKRTWFGEQEDLSQLFNTIQAKLKTNRRPRYVPPAGLTPVDIEQDMVNLASAESQRRSALNAQLRAILESLRKVFADLANSFHDKLAALKSALSSSSDQDLDAQIATLKGHAGEVSLLENNLAAIQQAERDCDAANIEENDKTDHTYDDLWFAHNLLTKAFQKTIDLLENQSSAREQADVSAEQVNEFKETFKHFDQDHDEKLSRLEFKSCLSGLGVVALDFEGSDKKFEAIFAKVANGGSHVDFPQFLSYLIDITRDEGSPEQIRDSFNVLAGGKDHITENDMKVGQMTAEQIAFLKSVLPPKAGIEGAYDYSAYVNSNF